MADMNRTIDINRDIYEEMKHWKENDSLDKVLYIQGTRQVGKTYAIKKFAKYNYDSNKIIYIDLTSDDLEILLRIRENINNELINEILERSEINRIDELFKRFSRKFEDSSECLVIIDEIQESPEIFSMIRQFARDVKTNFIITGSYLGRILGDKRFWISMGDMVDITMNPISFEEFLGIFNLRNLYNSLDFYGKSNISDYNSISDKFNEYIRIGGYPRAILEYLNGNLDKIESTIEDILNRFREESFSYISDSIMNLEVLQQSFVTMTNIMLNEKEGLKEDSLSEELKNSLYKDYSSNIGKASVNSALNWIFKSGIIKFCNKVIELDYNNFKSNQRMYFNDLGLFRTLSDKLKITQGELNGLICEHFIFNCMNYDKLRYPSFSTYKGGEIDFVYLNKFNKELYGIEVKAGSNSGKSITRALNDGKINKAIYCKGDTYGGIDGKIVTVPIYLFPRFLKEILDKNIG
ncbi:AAA family ATPase [Clostridium sp.]|uniref:ATP-binding protein n=1 Tax=Clostridium sp. TaxID=1506 RepID=UPI0026340869|nr:AAA family ATPase [Clostridium sp.]